MSQAAVRKAREFLIERLLAQASREGKPLSPSDVPYLRESGRADTPVAPEDIASDAAVLERVEPLLQRAYLADRRRNRSDGTLYEGHMRTLEGDDSLLAVAARSAIGDFILTSPGCGKSYALAVLALAVVAIVVLAIQHAGWVLEQLSK